MRYAGIDWVDSQYRAIVLDEIGNQIGTYIAMMTPEGLSDLIDWLQAIIGFTEKEQIACVIKSSNGILSSFLVDAGFSVYLLSPRVIESLRDAQENKTDFIDALLLARLGQSDLINLPRLTSTGALVEGKSVHLHILDSINPWISYKQEKLLLQKQNRYLEHGNEKLPEIALTFDDGPDPFFTPQILDVLRDYKAQATFFCIGLNIRSYPSIVKRICDEGHIVANHTWSHPYLPSLSKSDSVWQLTTTTCMIEQVIGVQPAFFRPPYGSYDLATLMGINSCNLVTTLWSLDSKDWSKPGIEAIVERIINNTRNGSIVLMHDGGGDRSQTTKALPIILEWFREHHFRLVTLPQILQHLHLGEN